MKYFKLYVEFIKIRMMSIAEYRKAFFIGAIAQFIGYGAQFIVLWLMLDHFQTINGWTKYEVILLYSFNLASYALAAFFLFNPTRQLSLMIKNGTFDEVLTKPLNSLLYLICRDFNTAYFSHLTLAVSFMIISFIQLGITLGSAQFFFLVITLIGGALIQGGLMLLMALPTFWIVENRGLIEILSQKARFVQYPISIYNIALQVILTLILPYAFVNFFPIQYLLQKDDFTVFHPSFQFLTPFVGMACMTIAYLGWTFAIKHYQSTGN